MANLPQINNQKELLDYLGKEFAYCGCGYFEDALLDLRTLLDFARRRQQAIDDKETEQFHAVTRELNEWLLLAPGLSTWFVWLLDDRDFIWHGKRTSDCYISKKGQLVLDAINAHYVFDE